MRFTVKKGFTLIELLIVVVIIGILAAIAIPKFASTKEKAYIASMKSDLKNLATSEEAYYSDKNTYSTDTTLLNFNTSTGNVLNILTGTNTGWSASITNARVSSITGCKIGSGTDTTGIGVDGVVVCN
ncbi:MAG TPA: prepilin-type N-terminal cleavage/methylation domain-containing protein [Gemmatimonadaceae bacterium]|nr:prepilin-type N-terminal cleavage/methylation domain-containing protein [Gemmatimonadaceae bacterium]